MAAKKLSITGPMFKLALESGSEFVFYDYNATPRERAVDASFIEERVRSGLFVHCECKQVGRSGLDFWRVYSGGDERAVFRAPTYKSLVAMREALVTGKAIQSGGAKRAPQAAVKALIAAIREGDESAVAELAPIAGRGEVDGSEPLVAAASKGAPRLVELMLLHCDPMADGLGRRAFRSAVASGSAETASMLLAFKDGNDFSGEHSLLLSAAGAGHREMVDLLLPIFDAGSVDRDGRNALMLAAMEARVECVEALASAEHAAAADKEGKTALMLAMGNARFHYERAGDTAERGECVLKLLRHSNVNVRDKNGDTALLHAVSNKASIPMPALRELVRLSDATLCGQFGHSALTIAAAHHQSLPLVQVLLERSDPNHQNSSGDTALMIAARHGAAETVRALLDRSDANLQDSEGATALMRCVSGIADSHQGGFDSMRCALRLIPASDVNVRGKWKMTALMMAVAPRALELFEMMLPKADVDVQDDEGRTALTRQAMRGRVDPFFDLLLPLTEVDAKDKRGVAALAHFVDDCYALEKLIPISDANAKDREGFTALMRAAEDGLEDAVELLLPVSNAELKNKEGRSASELAREAGHSALADAILAHVDATAADKAARKPKKPKKSLRDRTDIL